MSGSPATTNRPLRRRTRQTPPVAVALLAAASAVLAALADAQPTGHDVVDGVWRGIFGAVVVLATADARRWAWFPLAGVAAVVANGAMAVLSGGAALLLTFATAFMTRRRRWLGALMGLLAAQAILRGHSYGFTGLPTLVAIVACLPAAVSVYLNTSRRNRSVTRAALVVVSVVVVLLSIFTVVSAAQARDRVERAIDFGSQAVAAAEAGDQELAVVLIRAASDELGAIADDFNEPWLAPGRLVPVLGQHSRALRTLADAGSDVTASTARVLFQLDAERLLLEGGRVDMRELAVLVPSMNRLLDDLARSVARIEAIDRTWLASPAVERLDDVTELLTSRFGSAANARRLVEVAPSMLGANGERRYLVVFMTPAEARGAGGFAGNWAEITVDDGVFTVVDVGRGDELNKALPEGGAVLPDPEFAAGYDGFRLTEVFQNLPVVPDFPAVAEAAAAFYEQATGRSVDAVIGVDPQAMAGLVSMSGPVEIDGRTLDATQIEEFVLTGQYVEYEGDEEGRLAVLDQLTRVVFDQLASGELPSPWSVAEVMGPLAQQDHLRMVSFDEAEAEALHAVGVDDAFPEPTGQDLLAVVTQNVSENKIDTFLERMISYDVVVDPGAGAVTSTLTVTLTNTAPGEGLPGAIIGNNDLGFPFGTNVTRLQIYSPLILQAATIEDIAIPLLATEELGWNRYSHTLFLPAGESQTLILSLSGPLDLSTGYLLNISHQPMARPDSLRLSVEAAQGWVSEQPVGLDIAGASVLELSTDMLIAVGFRLNQ